MANCLFCDDFVGEVNGDSGAKGYTVGNRDICLACLQELKYRLEQVTAKSPIEREKLVESKELESTRSTDDDSDPFRAKAIDDE